MSCCAPGARLPVDQRGRPSIKPANEMLLASRDLGDGTRQTDLSVPGVHCAACIASVEKACRPARRRIRPREPLHETRHREVARGRGGAARSDRRPAGCRLRCPSVLDGIRSARSGVFAAHPGARGRGVLRDEHHAPVGIGVVGSRWWHAPGIPLDFGSTCPAGDPLLRAGFSSPRPGRRCAMDAPTWTCRFRSA